MLAHCGIDVCGALPPQVLDMLCISPQLEPAFAIRARIFAYPEGLMSMWLMLAVRYRGSTQGSATAQGPG